MSRKVRGAGSPTRGREKSGLLQRNIVNEVSAVYRLRPTSGKSPQLRTSKLAQNCGKTEILHLQPVKILTSGFKQQYARRLPQPETKSSAPTDPFLGIMIHLLSGLKTFSRGAGSPTRGRERAFFQRQQRNRKIHSKRPLKQTKKLQLGLLKQSAHRFRTEKARTCEA